MEISPQHKTSFTKKMLAAGIDEDEKKEKDYLQMTQTFEAWEDAGVLKMEFAKFVNQKLNPKEMLLPADIPSLDVEIHPKELVNLEERFAKKFVRPILKMNFTDFQTFYKKLTGDTGARGCTVRIGSSDLIISSNSTEFISHELRHAIDSYKYERTGNDNILNEFIAFFGEVIDPVIIESRITHTDGNTGKKSIEVQRNERKMNISQLGKNLKIDLYHRQCAPHLSYAEYEKLVDSVQALIEVLYERFSEAELERVLYRTKSITDLEKFLQDTQSK